MHVPADTEFQFHKGTIKTIYLINLLARFCDFNSIKVRLKRELNVEGLRIIKISIP